MYFFEYYKKLNEFFIMTIIEYIYIYIVKRFVIIYNFNKLNQFWYHKINYPVIKYKCTVVIQIKG